MKTLFRFFLTGLHLVVLIHLGVFIITRFTRRNQVPMYLPSERIPMLLEHRGQGFVSGDDKVKSHDAWGDEVSKIIAASVNLSRSLGVEGGDTPKDAGAKARDISEAPDVQPADIIKDAEVKASDIPKDAEVKAADIPKDAEVKAADIAKDAKVKAADIAKDAEVKAADIAKDAEVKAADIPKDAEVKAADITKDTEVKPADANGGNVTANGLHLAGSSQADIKDTDKDITKEEDPTEENKVAPQSPRMLTTLPPDRPATEPPEFIPDQPESSPVGRPPDIPTRFLIEEADFCQRRPGLQVIAYVHSSIMRVKQRNDTRATWANASAYDMGHMSVQVGAVFMVGRAKNDLERHIVQEESQRYHDIVQGDYGDHYRLLTYKGLASLYWINRHCPHVPWTLHADDDTHIDIFLYYKALQELDDESRNQFICSHMYGPALRSGRWKVRYEEYPAKDYPLYCSGGAWFLQTKFVSRLLNASRFVPFLWVDDAYITGLLANVAGIKKLPFHKYYGGPHIQPEKLGHQVAWFVKFASRPVWWNMIVNYHRNHSLPNPVRFLPEGKFKF